MSLSKAATLKDPIFYPKSAKSSENCTTLLSLPRCLYGNTLDIVWVCRRLLGTLLVFPLIQPLLHGTRSLAVKFQAWAWAINIQVSNDLVAMKPSPNICPLKRCLSHHRQFNNLHQCFSPAPMERPQGHCPLFVLLSRP